MFMKNGAVFAVGENQFKQNHRRLLALGLLLGAAVASLPAFADDATSEASRYRLAYIQDTLGSSMIRVGDFKAAQEQLEASLKLFPAHPLAQALRRGHPLDAQCVLEEGIFTDVLDRLEITLAQTQERDIAGEHVRVRHRIAAQWRYCLGSNGQIGAFIQRHANESKPRVGGEIRLGFRDDETSQTDTY